MAEPAPQSPLWWLDKLGDKLRARQLYMQKMDNYYCGSHPLPFLTKAHNAKMHDEFRRLLDESKSNFMELVVDAVEERMHVEGFRLSARHDPSDDERSWEIWQANNMDAESSTAITEALVKGVSYVSVWEGDEYPSIAVEDASQTIVGYVPGTNYRQRAAAAKIWTDDWSGERRANVYLTDGIHKYKAPAEPTGSTQEQQPRWVEIPQSFVPNPIGVVSIVPLRNRPRLRAEGVSEIESVFPIQNQINGFLFLLALGGYFGAHKQRWAVGLKIMEDANGKAVEPFDVDVGKLWVATRGEGDRDVQFGEFSQTQLDGYIKAIEQKVLHIATISRTPRHYLFQEGQSPSGDAIKSAESGLVKKVEKKQRQFGEQLEEVMRLARLFDGSSDAPVDSEIVWGDAATESEGVRTDSVIKQYEAKIIPWEFAAEELGYSQTQIARMKSMRQADLLERALLEANEKVSVNLNA